ncbi:MAG: hypothetical protein PVF34_07890 [Gammaproteobacteria bacterium]
MRIIWISVGICLVLLVVAFGFYQPVLNSQQSINDQQPDLVADPFAEDEPVAEETEVTLAALPQNTADKSPEPAVENPEHRELTNTQEKSTNFSSETDTAGVINSTGDQLSSGNLTGNANSDIGKTALTTQTDTTDTNQVVAHRTSALSIPSFSQKPENDKLAVIVHADNRQSLTPREIRAMYMDKLTRWDDGKRVMLYNLPLGDKHREQFSRRVLNMTALEADKLELERRANNRAINPVKVKAKNIVISYVERHPNAIAYVPLSQVRERSEVKVIMTFPK